jgi:hypothetical protein
MSNGSFSVQVCLLFNCVPVLLFFALTDFWLIIPLCTRKRGGLFYINNILHNILHSCLLCADGYLFNYSVMYMEKGRFLFFRILFYIHLFFALSDIWLIIPLCTRKRGGFFHLNNNTFIFSLRCWILG